MKTALFLVACAVLFVVPLAFVINKVYEDGILGRMALLGISFCAFGFGAQWWSDRIEPQPLLVFMLASVAAFICWHLWRFHRRVLKRARVPDSQMGWVRDGG